MIPLIDIDNINLIKRLFEAHVPRDVLEGYELPVSDHRAQVILGLSGGADSTVLALFAVAYLKPKYPNLKAIFTDTKNEPASCYNTLDKIERLTGMAIERITPEAGLFEKIDEYNGFIPSANARWCTRELKLNPLIEYLQGLPVEYGQISLAGIRSDEADRDGLVLTHSMQSQAKTAYPFVELGVTRNMVFDVLSESPIGVPKTYAYRSRSGCFSCFFQRRSEQIGMLSNDPQDFLAAEAVEKLTADDQKRWEAIPQALTDMGIHGYYPVPHFVDIRHQQSQPTQKEPLVTKATKDRMTLDLLEDPGQEEDTLYVAYALYVDAGLGIFGGREYTPGVYWQELAAMSPTLTGLKSSLANYYRFKMTTPMPMADPDDMKVVMAEVKFPAGTVDMGAPSRGSYTWKAQEAYKQIRHLTKHLQLTLERHDLDRRLHEARDLVERISDDDEHLLAMETLEQLQASTHASPESPGRVTWEGIFTPMADTQKVVQMQLDGVSVETVKAPVRPGLNHDDVPTACVMCSL